MFQSNDTDASKTPNPGQRIWQLITSNWITQAIYVAAELRIADLLAGGPRTSEELASATGTHAPSLHRLLRALTTLEVFAERDDGSFELTPTGSWLRSDSATSLRSLALFVGGNQWPLWGHLLDSIKTGETARKIVTGLEDFEHLQRDPAVAAIFHLAMVEQTRLVAQGVTRAYDFSSINRIVDVGGGYGELLAAILQASPGTQGVLFDLPHAIETARDHMAKVGLASRCEFLTGSFFESVPGRGDAYLLKSIIHDWDDARSKVILENCRRAMPDNGKLLLIERLLPERLEATADHQALARSDLTMLIGPGGCERTEVEFRALLNSAGFRMEKVIALELSFKLIEAIPAELGAQ